MARVVFLPSGQSGTFPEGTNLLVAARQLGVDLGSVCGGRGLCGRCKVDVAEGHFAKHALTSTAAHLTPQDAVEARYQTRRGAFKGGLRLGCQARICGDLVVDVPPESQTHRQVVRKQAEKLDISIDPVVQLYFVEVQAPDIDDPSSDFHRLQMALAGQWGLPDVHADLAVLAGLQQSLRAGDWAVTVALRKGRDIILVVPGFCDRALGLAVDIGSTTVAAHLCDLASGAVLASCGAMNPQIRFGEDLMSRLSHIQLNPSGREDLTRAARDAVNGLIDQTTREAQVERREILEVVVVGNPIMHHLFLGLDPSEIGVAPFALTIDGAHEARAQALGLDIAPGAFVYVLPCIAGHVGADAAAAILADGPHHQDEMTLLVDVGTNAEIILGNRGRLLACSSPTGPAFEGAQISCGQRATQSAIERVRIDRATLEPRFKIIGSDLWSDDPGFAEAIRHIGVSGVCGSGIIEAIAEMFLAGIITTDGVIDGSLCAKSNRIQPAGHSFAYSLHDGTPPLLIYQCDVRAIQLAKAALYAGAKLLAERMGTTGPTRIRLAGAFGSHIDPVYALTLGLVPDCAPANVTSIGNAAGTGARIALLNLAARQEIETLVRQIEKIETATDASFQDQFMLAMALPHKIDSFAHLSSVVALPTPRLSDRGGRTRRMRESTDHPSD